MKQFSIGIAVLFLFVFIGSTVYSGEYNLVNKSGTTVTGIYVLGSGSPSWSRLPVTSSINNGEKVTFDFQAGAENCVYSLKFTDTNGKEYFMDNINICETSEIILAVNEAESVPKIDLKIPGTR
ncbi:MAG: hypothetical protein IT281_01520 [Ignavibacteria bacterium]|nr:hypothetical protein [Ignavibacteria bacterium]MCC7158197.1 hypothetical protein [Ignavibacteria bacterium]